MPRIVLAVSVVALAGCAHSTKRVVPNGNVDRGKQEIEASGCGACHVIDGIPTAHGRVGPPLDGLAARSVIGGVLPNTPDNLVRWIEDAPSISPQTAMPNLGLTTEQARDVAAYLYDRP